MRAGRRTLNAVTVATAILAASCAGDPEVTRVAQGPLSRQDLEIVDCALPGQVRVIGGRTYISPRQPTRTTVTDCRVRGGEYVAYDRANLETALKIWLESAQLGNVEAQTTVGEIYERGLGVAPDYAQAVEWYAKAVANCGGSIDGEVEQWRGQDGCPPSRALFNLGGLYERGLGVAQDPLKALNLYRLSWGIDAGNILYEDAARRQSEELRAELQATIAELEGQIAVLKSQIEGLEEKLQETETSTGSELATLRTLVNQLETRSETARGRLRGLPVQTTAPGAPQLPSADPRVVRGMNLGGYYALVIGNQNYESVESLSTPRRDAERTAAVLRERYGFSVQVIEDADDIAMLRALNELNAVLQPEDNLLIYYAGHGERLKTATREVGFWLPINADPPPEDTLWVPNEQVTAHLARLPARRILVVADSCYAGLLSDDPDLLFLRDPGEVSLEWVRYKLPKRARLLISSGGDQPVLDEGGQGNSIFARAFLEVLESNQGVLSAAALFFRLQQQVSEAAARTGFDQKPEFKSIKSAGHEVGDFFLVPVGS